MLHYGKGSRGTTPKELSIKEKFWI